MNFMLPPATAVGVSGWDEHDAQVSRYFRGTDRGIKVRADIAGSQNDAVLRHGHDGHEAGTAFNAIQKSSPPEPRAAHN